MRSSSDGGGGEIDLGPADGRMYESGPPPGLSLFSPDGSEILSLNGPSLVALHLDGSGARTIAEPGPTRPWHAGFTPAGEVLFMQITNTEEPPDDTPDGEVVAEVSPGRPLGFTPDGSALFLSGTTLQLVAAGGETREIGQTFGSENASVEGLQAAYLDPARLP